VSVFNGFFGFRENPFNQTPDTSFFFPSEKHKSALNAMSYAVMYRKGFVVITGDIGCGKTTVSRLLLRKIDGKVKSACITNTHLSPKGVLTLILEDLGLPYREGPKEKLLLQLNHYLVQQIKEDQNVVFIIDEAQNLSASCLEEIRMLSNLETEKEKLIQIILLGQPELRHKLELPQLEQLRQRIRVSFHLSALSEEETKNYIHYRIEKAMEDGQKGDSLFEPEALELIYNQTHGVPRMINALCEHSLLSAFVAETKQINRSIVQESINELQIGGQKEYEQIYQGA
jgi:general secretion pathway protein A